MASANYPTNTINEIRELLNKIKYGNATTYDLVQIAYLYEGLDIWLSHEGQLPEQWNIYLSDKENTDSDNTVSIHDVVDKATQQYLADQKIHEVRLLKKALVDTDS